MSLQNKVYRGLRKAILGSTDLPQACDLPFYFPQNEIEVWLHGLGEPRDVTFSHSVACASPFVICIGFDGVDASRDSAGRKVSLKFSERFGKRQLLGEIGLELSDVFRVEELQLCLFKAISCSNFCLPWRHLAAHSVFNAFSNRKNRRDNDVRVSRLDGLCNEVTFICPRPVVLVSAANGERGNIFPMNLMGPVGRDYFAFALNSKKQTAPMVSEMKELVLSSIPFNHSGVVREMGSNHNRQSIDLERLPFKTRRSRILSIPVPEFVLRYRELRVEMAQSLGSHTFFVASTLGEEVCGSGPEFGRIHGLYEARRRHEQSGLPAAIGRA